MLPCPIGTRGTGPVRDGGPFAHDAAPAAHHQGAIVLTEATIGMVDVFGAICSPAILARFFAWWPDPTPRR